MDVFKGLLGSHTNYLAHVALNNCVDYFDLVAEQKVKGQDQTPDRYKRLRYFLNAIESLNNVPEYFFHEFKSDLGWKDNNMRDILGKIRAKHPILRDIEQITNAYKHSVRRNSKDLHAKDLQSPSLEFLADSEGAEVTFSFDSIEDENMMGEAFRFWHAYHQDPDRNTLVPDGKT
ncbi:hypothetical protein [Marinobacter nauticus]|uniref:hypothetical protein n=1 Tax=Marinobacter nauticus TaxID=2743 RepID=UPI001CD46180|nr:hypothetical protein [Marinobacter nauticus]MCA0912486.1 hypothetical protein [Marinobacter nauticus]